MNNIEINKTTLFINSSVHKHGLKYSYDKVKYTHSHNKVEIKCNTCMNIFHQTPRHHLLSIHCCPHCFKNTKFTLNTFIQKCILIHEYKFNYNHVIYTNIKTKIIIQCNTCNNVFKQTPKSHFLLKKCPICKF